MPSLFGDRGVTVRTRTRRASTVIVSILVHLAVLVALIVVPLASPLELPDVRLRLHAILPVTPAAPSIPAPPRPAIRAAVQTRIDAPSQIGPKPDVPAQPSTDGVMGSIDGVAPNGIPLGLGHGTGPVLATPSPPPPPPSPPMRVGGVIKTPVRVTNVAPIYPQLAQLSRIEGDVVLDAIIDESGKVASIRVLSSVPILDRAAIDAVRQWRYTPTLLNGIPVPVIMTVTVSFRLR